MHVGNMQTWRTWEQPEFHIIDFRLKSLKKMPIAGSNNIICWSDLVEQSAILLWIHSNLFVLYLNYWSKNKFQNFYILKITFSKSVGIHMVKFELAMSCYFSQTCCLLVKFKMIHGAMAASLHPFVLVSFNFKPKIPNSYFCLILWYIS